MMIRLLATTLLLLPLLFTNTTSAQDSFSNSTFLPIDLETATNQPKDETFAPGGYPGDNLSELAEGVQNLGGIEFDIKSSVVQMMGKHLHGDLHQATFHVDGLYVGTTVEKLHILHAARWGAYGKRGDKWNHWVPDGVPIAYYEVVYQDESVEAIPIVYGQDVRDWWSLWDDNKPTTRSKVVWTGTNPHLKTRKEAKGVATPLRLYHSEWVNPHPEKRVTDINIVSLDQVPALFTVAMTVETTEDIKAVEKQRLEEQLKRLKQQLEKLKKTAPKEGGGGAFF